VTAIEQLAPVELGRRPVLELSVERRISALRRRGWLVRRMLLLADVLGLVGAFALTELVFGRYAPAGDAVHLWEETLLFTLTLPMWVVFAKLYRLYDRDEERTDHTTVDDMAGVFHLVTVGTWIVYAGALLTAVARPELAKTVTFWAVAIVGISFARVGARAYCRRHISYIQNTVIIGSGTVCRQVAKKVLKHPEYGINLVGFVDDDPAPTTAFGLAYLGTPDRLPELDVERAVIAFTRSPGDETVDVIRMLNDLGVQIDIVPRFFDVIGPTLGIHSVEGMPLIGLPPFGFSRSSALLKRTLDLVVSLAGLAVLAPFFLLAAIAIKLDSPGSVFFRQERMGAGDRTFRIWKLRTMVADADERKDDFAHLNKHNGHDPRMFKIEGDPRVTRVGRLLRRTFLDELPQLINVACGEMSLVGPRPLILDEDQHVDEWARKRLDLKPGMTGLWQVLGRSSISFEEMVVLDYRYVTSWSLGADLRLLLRTVPLMLKGGGGAD
jgi:exopolysaccharide biosynthesis polyprenyl glycosylphosphotransferase